MSRFPLRSVRRRTCLLLAASLAIALLSLPANLRADDPPEPSLDVGIAVRDVTPEGPIWLAGYEARKRPSERIDHPLLVQAIALRSRSGERVVIVALDNCEVNREFIMPLVKELEAKHSLPAGSIMIVSSHTHSAPVLEGPIMWIYRIPEADLDSVARYGELLKARLAEALDAALADLKPALLEHGVGRASFAMNRRQYSGGRVIFGDNPDGPVDWDVPVLRVKSVDGVVRAIVFGYACHATTVRGKGEDDWYAVSADYIGYARQHLEAVYPGATAIYLTGMGADSDPSPRGDLLIARRHGLELAGTVTSVLARPMRPVQGPLTLAYEELDLPLPEAPSRERLEKDASGENENIRIRARNYLKLLDESKVPPQSVKLSLAAIRLGNDLTFIAMGGEPVVDYARRFKRLFAADHPWTIGYAYDVPCYIPTARIIAEGGYEGDTSLIYASLYGPFKPQVEEMIEKKAIELVTRVRR